MVTRRNAVKAMSLLLAVAAACAGACNAVLGFGEANVDPSITTTSSQTEPLTCDSYCTAIMANCTGDYQEYLNTNICTAMCAYFELGILNQHMDDSLACRLYHAESAKESPAVHCRHAGPSGGGHCGDMPCNAFCLLDTSFCTGALSAYDGGDMGCRAECAKYPYLMDPGVPDLLGSGNTLNCRMWHLESAFDPGNPAAKSTHCPHTASTSVTCF